MAAIIGGETEAETWKIGQLNEPKLKAACRAQKVLSILKIRFKFTRNQVPEASGGHRRKERASSRN